MARPGRCRPHWNWSLLRQIGKQDMSEQHTVTFTIPLGTLNQVRGLARRRALMTRAGGWLNYPWVCCNRFVQASGA